MSEVSGECASRDVHSCSLAYQLAGKVQLKDLFCRTLFWDKVNL